MDLPIVPLAMLGGAVIIFGVGTTLGILKPWGGGKKDKNDDSDG